MHDNPAGRLHDILGRARAQPQNISALTAWATLLGIGQDIEGKAEILRRGADMMVMGAEVESRVAALLHPPPPGVIESLHGVGRCLDLFTALPKIQLAEMMAPYTDVAAQALATCSWALSRDDPDAVISDEGLHQLQSDVEDLLAEVRDSTDLDEGTRQEVTDHLTHIRDLLGQIPERGTGPARSAINLYIGQIVVNHFAAPAEKQVSGVRERVFTFLLGASLMLAQSVTDTAVGSLLVSGQAPPAIGQIIRQITGS